MPNMSYCRFTNTLQDLRDCYENWENEEAMGSEEEKRARSKLLSLCKDIVESYGDSTEEE